MSLTATITWKGDVSIVRLNGRITLGEGSQTLRETFKTVIDSGETKVLLDFAGVGYIDSCGLGALVGSYTSGRNKGITIKLLNLQKRVEGLMQLTKLYLVFEAFENEADALQSFTTMGAASA
jgi:anti-sigma B factor antagonist